MNIYLYVIARDFGFAPNPFGGICTLATCKPGIRNAAQIGDWVIGLGAAKNSLQRKLVCIMEVTDKITFNDYWTSEEYQFKKPVMNGSLVQNYGDNIYFLKNGKWHQADSHHSLPHGKPNMNNLMRDTKSPYVLASKHFFFFGKNAIPIPKRFAGLICWSGRNFKRILENPEFSSFIDWLSERHQPGLHSDPLHFGKSFKRYDGIS